MCSHTFDAATCDRSWPVGTAVAARPDETNLTRSRNAFDPLDLDDPVVITLLFERHVDLDQVATAWHQQRMYANKEDLWRVLAVQPGVDRDAVLRTAARLHGYEEILVPLAHSLALLHEAQTIFSEAAWRSMIAHRVLPVARFRSPFTSQPVWIFASPDPQHPDLQEFLDGLCRPFYELRFVPEVVMEHLIRDAFLSVP